MKFNINQLDKIIYEGGEEEEKALEDYQDALLEIFSLSEEGRAFFEGDSDPDQAFWAYQLMYFGFTYEGVSIPKMTVRDVQQIVTGLFPRKISLSSEDEAEEAIPELIAFWQFLKREYKLSTADDILTYLRKIEPEFKDMMMDPANFGMAKSFFMMGQSSGYDMTDEAEAGRFINIYNAGLLAQGSGGLPLPDQDEIFGLLGGGPPELRKPRRVDQAKKKKTRKITKASQKKNRKK
jgi:hypothetical protein